MTTRADRSGSGYVINGKKHWITGGGVSKLHLIFARIFDGAVEQAQGVTAGNAELAIAVDPATFAMLSAEPRGCAVGPKGQDLAIGAERGGLMLGLQEQLGEPVQVAQRDLLLQVLADLEERGQAFNVAAKTTRGEDAGDEPNQRNGKQGEKERVEQRGR